MGRTMAEKMLSARAGREVRAGDMVVCRVDLALGTDGSAPMALDYFEAMGADEVVRPHRVLFSRDHYAPPASVGAARLHDRMLRFSRAHGVEVLDVGEGISFLVAVERGLVLPGSLVVGADSHTVTAGALNSFSVGVGSSDLAASLACGTVWLKVPESIRVDVRGRLQPGVLPKDAVLGILARLGADGADYRALEFGGPGVAGLDMEARLVLSNMAVEAGAKAALFPFDAVTEAYLESRTEEPLRGVAPDAGATYAGELDLDLSTIPPHVSVPPSPEDVHPVTEVAGQPVDVVFVGTCTGGRASDFRALLHWIRRAGGRVNERTQLVLTPASREVLLELQADGTLQALVALGAVLTTAGCGPCCGTSGPIPGDGAVVLSTANRNFRGRMGNLSAEIFLSSPAVCGVSAVRGRITDPREVGAGEHPD